MAPRRTVVYLAGPVSGCNARQRSAWREEARAKLGAELTCIEPLDVAGRPDASPSEVVERDRAAIRRADALLANMWKESIGTAMAVFQAWEQGKVIVVADPNHLQSRAIAYYADAVTDSVGEAVKHLKHIFRAQHAIERVIKRDGAEEPFDRRKLSRAVRRACWDAGLDDVLYSARIRPRVVEELLRRGPEMDRSVRSSTISRTVLEVLESFAREGGGDWDRIARAWRDGADSRRAQQRAPAPAAGLPRIHDAPQHASVWADKSHTTIWGVSVKSLTDVPQPARSALAEILRLDGVKGVRLTRMRGGAAGPAVGVEILASRARGVIEGRLRDRAGVRGHVQCFQVLLLRPAESAAAREALERHLAAAGYLRRSAAVG